MSPMIRVTLGSSSIRLLRRSFMPWPPTCAGLITAMAVFRIMVRGADRAGDEAARELPPPIGFAPAAAMVFTRKPILPITTSCIPNRRTVRCRVWICAPVAALAFARAPRRRVAAVEAVPAVAAVAASRNPEPAQRRHRKLLRIRRQHWPQRQPPLDLEALAEISR